MFRKFIAFASAMLMMTGMSYAQLPCSTDEHYHELLKKYPQLASMQEQFDDQVNQHLARTTASGPDTAILDVPVVVHIIHDYGSENVTDNVIYDAAAYWAVVYMKQNPDTAYVIPPFIPYIGKSNIRLHLATIDPNGKPTKGVVRLQSYLTSNADDQAKYDQWPQDKYVNIWIINKFGASATGAAAYAILPGTVVYEPYYDGVICLATYINYAKTIPHELGHVFNLQHTWGNSNNPDVACGNDGVDDTPPTKGHNSVGCVPSALYDTTCAGNYMKTYKDITGADSIVDYPDTVNSQNIMDYTYCEEMFTIGQCARMRKALNSATGNRSNLITAANLAATGALAPMPDLPPVADFYAARAVNATVTDARTSFLAFNSAGSFQFRNASWNDTVSDVLWTFSNGATTPSSTASFSVNNQFSQPGWVTVSLVANSNAGSDTFVNTHAVYAADTTPVGGFGYSQDFASASDIDNWPMFNYYKNQFRWQTYDGAGLGDNSCVRYRSFDTSKRITGMAIGDYDDFFTPAFNLADVSVDNMYLNFFTAGAYTSISGGVNDSMQVQVSVDGGAKWVRLAGFKGMDLANNGAKSNSFVPVSDAQWKARGVSIPTAYRNQHTYFRFRYWPGTAGNNLYLDKFYIYQFPAGVKETMTSASAFSVVPNPATNGCSLIFRTGNNGTVSYCIKDVTGKVVYQAQKEFIPDSLNEELISRSVTPFAGMYFVTITIDGVNTTQKLVVY